VIRFAVAEGQRRGSKPPRDFQRRRKSVLIISHSDFTIQPDGIDVTRFPAIFRLTNGSNRSAVKESLEWNAFSTSQVAAM
jgi:hypothetical protein